MVLLTGVFLALFGVFATGAVGFLMGFSSTSLSSMLLLELADSLDALLAGLAACWPFFFVVGGGGFFLAAAFLAAAAAANLAAPELFDF